MTLIFSLLFLTLAGFSSAEKGNLEVKNQAFKVVEGVDEKGKKVITHVQVDEASIIPKDQVIYVTTVKNIGTEPAENIVVTNPIPPQLSYIEGTAKGKATDISFSVNQGKSYHQPENIVIKTKQGTSRTAQAKDYNSIQWVYLSKLKPGKETTMSYQAILGLER